MNEERRGTIKAASARLHAGFLLAIAWLVFPVFAGAQNLALNPSFETLGHANWTAVFNPSGGATFPDSSATPPTTDGANGIAATDAAVGTYYLYPDVVLPLTGPYRISVDVGNSGGSGATDFVRVDITDTTPSSVAAKPKTDTLATPDPDVVQSVFSRSGADPVAPQARHAANFVGSAGQTVRIRFYIHASNVVTQFPFDDVQLLSGGTPVPTLSEWAMLLLGALLALFGIGWLRRRAPGIG